jgi:hypothetical protein
LKLLLLDEPMPKLPEENNQNVRFFFNMSEKECQKILSLVIIVMCLI